MQMWKEAGELGKGREQPTVARHKQGKSAKEGMLLNRNPTPGAQGRRAEEVARLVKDLPCKHKKQFDSHNPHKIIAGCGSLHW